MLQQKFSDGNPPVYVSSITYGTRIYVAIDSQFDSTEVSAALEATFDNGHAERAALTFHSTAEQAATIALKANVGQLIIGHFSSRYRDLTPLWDEAKNVFPNTLLGGRS